MNIQLFRSLILLTLLAAPLAAPALAQTPPEPIPADTCILELTLPHGATVTTGGRDYGVRQRLTWGKLAPGQIRVESLTVNYSGGGNETFTILVEGGQRIRLATLNPNVKRPATAVQGPSITYSLTFYPNSDLILACNPDRHHAKSPCMLIESKSQAIFQKVSKNKPNSYLRDIRYFPSNNRILTIDDLSIVSTYDSKDGMCVSSARLDGTEQQSVFRTELSRDGNMLLGNLGGRAVVWEVKTGRTIGKYPPQDKTNVPSFAAVFAPDGQSVIAGQFGINTPARSSSSGVLWDPRTGSSRDYLLLPKAYFSFSPEFVEPVNSSGLLVTCGFGNRYGDPSDQAKWWSRCFLWNDRGGYLRSFLVAENNLRSITSPDGHLLVLSSDRLEQKEIYLHSATTGTLVRKLSGKPHSFALNKRLLSLTDDKPGNLLVDLSTGKEIVRLIRFVTDDDWVAVTPEGLFDGTESGRKQLAFQIGKGTQFVELDRFFQDFYRPGLLNEIFRGERPLPSGEFANQAAPLVKVLSPKQGAEVEARSVQIEVEVTDRGGGIDGPWLMHNGARVIADGEKTRDGKVVRQTLTAALVEGENRFEVRAASSDGSWESEPAALMVKYTRPVARPAVHLVAVGVNEYAHPSLNLKFAAPDATAMTTLFQTRGKTLYGEGQVHVSQVLNKDATRAGIEKALQEVAKVANPQDTLVVFLAGHGTTLGQRYYFIPHEFAAKAEKLDDDIRAQGIAGDVLGDWVEKVPALKRVLIFDTCQSGGALPVSRTARDPFAFRGALERLSHSRGFFTIAAASASETAQEVPELKHGLLTYALLAGAGVIEEGPLANQGIRATADDKVVEVREWFSFAQDKVPLLTKLYLGQEQLIGFTGQGNSFPVLPAKEN